MCGHVSDTELMDVIEGTASATSSTHVSQCRECAERVEEARAGLGLAREVEVPEPSPFYWESFRRQVEGRIAATSRLTAWKRWALAPVLTLAAGLVVALSILIPTSRVSAPPAPQLLPAWSALPPSDQDEGLEVLQAMTLGEELPSLSPGEGVTEHVEGLSEEESLALASALRQELSGKGRL
jgi:hypothetical protein